ncbi:hypothetical protein FOB58_004025 [Candida parapsilosis]|nr:hypothetical protein FOB58_004025 [Candida parapsilosis]
MGLKYTNYFDNSQYTCPDTHIFTCKGCSSHLCLSNLVLSDNFNGSSGPALLVEQLINVDISPITEDTSMRTGLYKITRLNANNVKRSLAGDIRRVIVIVKATRKASLLLKRVI